MNFSVIYSIDVPSTGYITPYIPPQRHLWTRTEGDGQFDYGYLGGEWAKGKHRKLCAVLTKAQFERFLSDTGLYAESTETMGSLGAPGCGYGISPAVSFNTDCEDAILNAYVTPIPEVQQTWQEGMTETRCERLWQLVRRAMLRKYGCGSYRDTPPLFVTV